MVKRFLIIAKMFLLKRSVSLMRPGGSLLNQGNSYLYIYMYDLKNLIQGYNYTKKPAIINFDQFSSILPFNNVSSIVLHMQEDAAPRNFDGEN